MIVVDLRVLVKPVLVMCRPQKATKVFGDATIAQHRVDNRCRTDNMAYASDRTHITNAQTFTERAIPKSKNDRRIHESGRYSRSVSVRPVILAGVTRVHAWAPPRVSLSQIVDIFSVNEDQDPALDRQMCTTAPLAICLPRENGPSGCTSLCTWRCFVFWQEGRTDSKHVRPFCFSALA